MQTDYQGEVGVAPTIIENEGDEFLITKEWVIIKRSHFDTLIRRSFMNQVRHDELFRQVYNALNEIGE